jgi:hypothetical protein
MTKQSDVLPRVPIEGHLLEAYYVLGGEQQVLQLYPFFFSMGTFQQ